METLLKAEDDERLLDLKTKMDGRNQHSMRSG